MPFGQPLDFLVEAAQKNPLQHIETLFEVDPLNNIGEAKDNELKFQETRIQRRIIASSLFWLPLSVLTLSLGVGTLPRSSAAWLPIAYQTIGLAIVAIWLCTMMPEKIYNRLVNIMRKAETISPLFSFFPLILLLLFLILASTALFGILRGIESNWVIGPIISGIIGVSFGSNGIKDWTLEIPGIGSVLPFMCISATGIAGVLRGSILSGIIFAIVWFSVAKAVDKMETQSVESGCLPVSLSIVMIFLVLGMFVDPKQKDFPGPPDLLAGIGASITMIVADKLYRKKNRSF